jgi:hypothetical protein
MDRRPRRLERSHTVRGGVLTNDEVRRCLIVEEAGVGRGPRTRIEYSSRGISGSPASEALNLPVRLAERETRVVREDSSDADEDGVGGGAEPVDPVEVCGTADGDLPAFAG